MSNSAGNNWTEKNGKLFCRFEFEDFKTALDFVNKVGLLAEEANHHPDVSFGWGYVEISLFSHSKNEITGKDKELSEKISKIVI